MIAGEGGIVPIPDPEKIVKNFLESFKRRLKKGSWVCILLPGSVLSSNVPMGRMTRDLHQFFNRSSPT